MARFYAGQVDYIEQLNLLDDIVLNMTASFLKTTSTSNNDISTGSKTFIVPTGLQFTTGMFILIVDRDVPTSILYGTVTSYVNDTLVVNITYTEGSGAGIVNWSVQVTGIRGPIGATGPVSSTGTAFGTNMVAMYADTTGNVLTSSGYAITDFLKTGWTGSSSISTVGTITSGTWSGTAIASNKITTALTGHSYEGLLFTDYSLGTGGFMVSGNAGNISISIDTNLGAIPHLGDFTIVGEHLCTYTFPTVTSTLAAANQTMYIGTTPVNINRASGALILQGITSIDGAAATTGITDNLVDATTKYLTWVDVASGDQAQKVSSTKLSFVPSTGTLNATNFVGNGSGLTGVTASTNAAAAGADTQIQFNDGGIFGGDADFTWNKATNTLTFGASSRITGDFSNATHASRTLFKTTLTNGNTVVGFIPDGTGATSQLNLYNKSDVDNCAFLAIYYNASNIGFSGNVRGTGTHLPMVFAPGATTALTLDVNGVATFASNIASTGNSISVDAAANGAVQMLARNATSATNATARFLAGNSTTTAYGQLIYYSPLYTTVGARVADSAGLLSSGATAGLNVGTLDATPLKLWTNNALAVTVASGGAATFTSSISAAGVITGANGGSGEAFIIGNDTSLVDINVADTFAIRGRTGSANNGHVRFGDTGPTMGWNQTHFAIRSTGVAHTAYFSNGATTGQFQIGQGLSTAGDGIGYLWNVANSAVAFGTNNAERVRITADGYFGIGVTPTAALGLLQVQTGTNGTAAKIGNGAFIGGWNNDAHFASGGTFDSAGTWTARASTASGVYYYQGTANFWCNTGLTASSTFTPASTMLITPSVLSQGWAGLELVRGSTAWAGIGMWGSNATKRLGMHYGNDGTAGNELRLGRYTTLNAWETNPISFNLDTGTMKSVAVRVSGSIYGGDIAANTGLLDTADGFRALSYGTNTTTKGLFKVWQGTSNNSSGAYGLVLSSLGEFFVYNGIYINAAAGSRGAINFRVNGETGTTTEFTVGQGYASTTDLTAFIWQRSNNVVHVGINNASVGYFNTNGWNGLSATATSPSSADTSANAATTSGTSVSVCSIGSATRHIVLSFDGVSTNSTSGFRLILTGGTLSVATGLVSFNDTTTGTNSWGGHIDLTMGIAAANTYFGYVELRALGSDGLNWVVNSHIVSAGGSIAHRSTGHVRYSVRPTTLTLTTILGTSTFDAGSVYSATSNF